MRNLDMQRIAELFAASADLEELYFGPEPVIRTDSRGGRKISLMRWGFKREDAKLLFNARAEGITDVNFWKKSFSLRRCIVPADSFFEWQKSQQGTKSKFEFTIRDRKTIWNGRPMVALEEPEDQSMGRHFRDRDRGCE